MFVVEASSFRLGHTDRLRCSAATWLNFAPDHLDVHASLDAYEAAKASIWADLDDPAVAIAVIDDAVVRTHAPSGATTVGAGGDWYSDGEQLHGPDGPFLAVRELPRSLPHDQVNALADVDIQIEYGCLGLAGAWPPAAGLEGCQNCGNARKRARSILPDRTGSLHSALPRAADD